MKVRETLQLLDERGFLDTEERPLPNLEARTSGQRGSPRVCSQFGECGTEVLTIESRERVLAGALPVNCR